jgi:hypothetical protein
MWPSPRVGRRKAVFGCQAVFEAAAGQRGNPVDESIVAPGESAAARAQLDQHREITLNHTLSGRFAALLAAGLSMFAALAAQAAQVGYLIDFTFSSSQTCTVFGCQSPPQADFTGTFTLDSTALSSDGAKDISSTIAMAALHRYDNLTSESQTYTAFAEVVAGRPVDIDLHYSGSWINTTGLALAFTTGGSDTFTAHGGAWSDNGQKDALDNRFASTHSATGSYTITEIPLTVPEPGAVVLMGVGLLALAGRARRSGSAAYGGRPI